MKSKCTLKSVFGCIHIYHCLTKDFSLSYYNQIFNFAENVPHLRLQTASTYLY